MTIDKSKIAARIKALLAKTVENGCSEDEALAAASKAAQLMQEYQISMTEAEIVAEGFEQHRINAEGAALNFIKERICNAVSEYTSTRVWRSASQTAANKKDLVFFGLASDTLFAEWLLHSLTGFVMTAAKEFEAARVEDLVSTSGYTKREAKAAFKSLLKEERASFVLGMCHRIAERLRATKVQTMAKAASETALVVINKGALVDAELAKLAMRFKSGRSTRNKISRNAYDTGHQAGEGAQFSRPVNGGAGVLRIR